MFQCHWDVCGKLISFWEHIERALPKVFVLENVKGFRSVHEGAAYDDFMGRLNRIRDHDTGKRAYNVTPMLLNALDYGSPQSRVRYYFVGVRRDFMHDPNYYLKNPIQHDAVTVEDFLDLPDEHDNHRTLPKSPAAVENVKYAFEKIKALNMNPAETFIFDCDTSKEWRPRMFRPKTVPCLTFSRSNGLWISSRGRRMRPQECMRIQGIGRRKLDKASPNKVREMVGNSMHVGTVSAVIRTAFKAMKT